MQGALGFKTARRKTTLAAQTLGMHIGEVRKIIREVTMIQVEISMIQGELDSKGIKNDLVGM